MGALKLEQRSEIKNQPKGFLKIALKGLGWVVGLYLGACAVAVLAGAFHGYFIDGPQTVVWESSSPENH